MAKKMLFSFELEPGMIVYDDVFDSSGRLILPKGAALDDSIISKLEFFSILEVPIDDEVKQEEKKKSDVPVVNYSQTIKKSTEFKMFNSNYQNCINSFKQNLQSIVNSSSAINAESMIGATHKLISECKNTIHMFDMIHCLRESDDQTYTHSLNVAIISTILGKWLNMSKDDLSQLTLAGILHDIGKLTIPSDILNKPGKLTDEEFDLVKSHVKNGYDILRKYPLDVRVKEACLLHHERCDGTGYPFSVTGNKISSFAKIVAIADVYDAMTAARSYRGAKCAFDVLQMFDEEGLYKFDPHYIMTFLQNIVSSYLHNNVKLSDGREGEIIMINSMCLYRPVVRIGDEFINLIKEPNIKIVSIME